MAYRNGAIPLSALSPLPGGGYATPAAAAAYERMNAAYTATFGHSLTVNSAYRTLAQQAALVAHPQGGIVAPVGTSAHGLGIAFDFGNGAGTKGSATSNWLYQNAGKYGIVPTGASFSSPEFWHWQYAGGGTNAVTAAAVSGAGATGGGPSSPYAQPSGNLQLLPWPAPGIPKRFLYDGGVMAAAIGFGIVGIVLVTRPDVQKTIAGIVSAAKSMPVPVPV